ncbi:ParB/RepB/Spo0J family partition protein [SAR116 cluster bacterium]|nr:ParB/RepB/Spo0J family partition protein [SAR116 cluster bacterium]
MASAKDQSGKNKPKTSNVAAKKLASKNPASRGGQRQRGLGRGLSSLLGDAGVAAATSTQAAQAVALPTTKTVDDGAVVLTGLSEIPIEWINSGPWQPRRKFDQTALKELSESIRSKGLVQPILVRPRAESKNRYELIAGERRWRAAQMAQLHKIPAIIREFSDEEAYEVALIENIQRADLSVIEEADGYRQLIDAFGYTQDDLSEIIGKSRSHIANLLRLLSLPSEITDMVVEGVLTMGQVRPLIGHENSIELARDIARRGLSARQVEALVAKSRGAGKSGSKKQKPEQKSANTRATEQMIADRLGLKVNIDWDETRETGRMVLYFTALEQFEEVLSKLDTA